MRPRAQLPLVRLGLLTATWQRPVLTAQVLAYYAALEPAGVDLVRVAVHSPEDPMPHSPVDGWHYVPAGNDPLGAKWNTGLAALEALDVDAVMVVGSDDVISESFFDHVRTQLVGGREVVACRDPFFYSPPDNFVSYCRSMTCGSGRVVATRVLVELKWKLWDAGIHGMMDSSAQHRLAQVNARRHNARNSDRVSWAIAAIKPREGEAMWRLKRREPIPGIPPGMDLVRPDGVRQRINKVVQLPAQQFFGDYFPTLEERYMHLGTEAFYG